jgi:hypothetical protein
LWYVLCCGFVGFTVSLGLVLMWWGERRKRLRRAARREGRLPPETGDGQT